MADNEDVIENITNNEVNDYSSEEEVRLSIDYGNNFANEEGNNNIDEDGLDATNSSLAYLTHVRQARKKKAPVGAPRRTCTTRVIACTTIGFLVICLTMVGVSLLMSKNIDNLGKFYLHCFTVKIQLA